MKIKKGFISREVAGSNVVVATGAQSKNFNGVIKLNESGLILWNLLVKGAEADELVEALIAEYDVDRATAVADADKFVGVLKDAGALDN